MKKIFTLLSLSCALFVGRSAYAQSFTIEHDTVYHTASGTLDVYNRITNTTSANDSLDWYILSSTWPSDWFSTVGICDNFTCFSGLAVGEVKQSDYPPGLGDFHVQADLSAATTVGTFVLRIRINNKHIPTDTAIQTYIVTKNPVSIRNTPKVVNTDISLYPNPATSSLNVVYDAGADIKNIAVYNIIGKQMSIYRVSGNTGANLNIENLPSGIYFVRLLNSRGDVFATRKFTKQ